VLIRWKCLKQLLKAASGWFGRKELGSALIETLVALALMGIVAATFVGSTGTAAKATTIADEQATAKRLAQTQMEYLKSQDYINYADPDHGEYLLITTPVSYSTAVTAVPIDPLTGQPLALDEDNGIQKISVTINRNDREVAELESYKVNR